MTNDDVVRQLEAAALSEEFAAKCSELTAMWQAGHVDDNLIEAILLFMETHPTLDYGMPGALVHFVERFYRKGYERQLVLSIARRPTPMTVWMLNRLINGQPSPETRQPYVEVLKQAKLNASADSNTVQLIERFVRHHCGDELNHN